MLEKTDAIGCEMTRDFAASPKTEQLRFVRPMSDGFRRLKRSAGARRNLVKARVLVASQLENLLDKDTKSAVTKAVEALDRQIGKMDALCIDATRSDERMGAPAARFGQIVGVGHVPISTMPSSCPDIGSFTPKGIAKMIGVAPIENRSRTIKTKSKSRRGRGEL